jgi:hypothetical protein
MSTSVGPSIINSNVILSLDPNNRKSYIDGAGSSLSSINTYLWDATGNSVTGFGLNQTIAGENLRLNDTDPWGNTNMVWGTHASGDGNADGGWNCSWFNIDKTQIYRSAVWVRRISSTTSGTFYHGLHTNGTGDTLNTGSGASQTNPYWDYRNVGGFTQNQWYLSVGHIFPYTYTGGIHPDSGFWTTAGSKVLTNGGNIPNDVYFPSDATQAYQRVYHYYCGDNTTRLQFAYPRWDVIDGREPSISELLSKAPSRIYDLTNNINGNAIYRIPPVVVDGNTRCFDFSGNTGLDSTSALYGFSWDPQPIPNTGNFTFNTWVKSVPATVGQQLLFSNTANANGYRFGIGANGVYWLIGPTYQEGTLTFTGFVNTQWNNVCVIFDRTGSLSGGTPKIYSYLNGVLNNSTTIPASQTAWTTSGYTAAYMAKWNGPTFATFSGKLGKFEIYNKSLSSDEILKNFNALKGRYGL